MRIKNIQNLFLTAILIIPINLMAQTKDPGVSGEITIESYEEVKKSDAPTKRASTIDYIREFRSKIKELKNGKISKVEPAKNAHAPALLSADMNGHLAVAYLRCSVAKGICKYFLDTIQEMDLINSRINKKVDCSTLKRFWKYWSATDLEKRHRHSVQIGYLKSTETFNKDERPKYIRCDDTLNSILDPAKQSSDLNFFKERYNSGEIENSVDQTIDFLEILEKGDPSVFLVE